MRKFLQVRTRLNGKKLMWKKANFAKAWFHYSLHQMLSPSWVFKIVVCFFGVGLCLFDFFFTLCHSLFTSRAFFCSRVVLALKTFFSYKAPENFIIVIIITSSPSYFHLFYYTISNWKNYRSISLVAKTLLSVREVWGSNTGSVKLDTVSPTARHPRCDVSSKQCSPVATSRRQAPPFITRFCVSRDCDEDLVFFHLIWKNFIPMMRQTVLLLEIQVILNLLKHLP